MNISELSNEELVEKMLQHNVDDLNMSISTGQWQALIELLKRLNKEDGGDNDTSQL